MNICWITIHVTNMAVSKKFYCEILGLKVKTEFSPRPGTNICFLDGGDVDYELIDDAGENDITMSRSVSVGFTVDSLDAAIDNLNSRGITEITGPIQPSPDSRFIFITDPDGMTVQLVEQVKKS